MLKHAIALTLSIFLASCATPPATKEQFDRADFGVSPQQHEKTIRKYFDSTLRDPGSALYKEISSPEKGAISNAFIDGGGQNFGWLVYATINAKNAYGGYVGYKTYTFLFRGESLIKVKTPDSP